jgi:branched-chain amino acid transport system substrate-binding protein
VTRPWRALAGGLLLAAALGASTAAARECPKGSLHIYTSLTLHGPMLSASTGMKNGVDLAVAEAGGALAGYCLDVVHLSNASPQTGKWDGAVEAENAGRAVADPHAMVYVGPYNSGAAKVSIPITNRAHLAQVTLGATYPGLTKRAATVAPGEPWIYRPLALVNFFRPLSADDVQGAAGARWARRLGLKTVFVIHDDELYGKGIATVFEATARRLGLTILANQGIDWRQADQRPVLAKILASGADLVYMGGVIETGAPVILRQMQEVGLVAPGVRFMGPDGLFVDELLAGPTCDAAVATDMRVTFPGLPLEKLTGTGARTREEYRRAFGREPTAFALYAVEAGRVAVDGIRRAAAALDRAGDLAGKRDAVRKAIAATRNFDGINGRWSFDREGDIDAETVSGFRVVRTDGPTRCRFQLETILQPGG